MNEVFDLMRRYPTAFVAIVGGIVLCSFLWGYAAAYPRARLNAYAEKARFEAMRGQ